uniref:WH2 domain-containing protein n=1 Tax=Parastrongyloides trichosuri TaxID=131310 RepID=A0A0N5A016_PARTI
MIKASTILNLTNYGVKPSDMCWYALSINSNNVVMCFVKGDDGSKKIILINLDTKSYVVYPSTVDSIKMNYYDDILALKNKSLIQVVKLKNSEKIITFNMPFDIEYWSWMDEKTLGFICSDKIYYFDIYKDIRPVLTINRKDELNGYNIIDHQYDKISNFYYIIGLKKDVNKVYGKIVLRDQTLVRHFDGVAGCFFKYRQTGCVNFDKFFAYIDKNSTRCCIKIIQLTSSLKENIIKETCEINVNFSLAVLKSSDIPKALYFCEILGTFYIVTREAKIFAYNFDLKKEIGRKELKNKIVVTSSFDRKNNSIILFVNDGNLYNFGLEGVLPITVSPKDVDYNTISNIFRNSINLNLPNNYECIEVKFERFIKMENFMEAARLAGNDRNDKLRTQDTMTKLLNHKSIDQVSECFETYIKCIMNRTTLNALETHVWIRYLIETENKHLIEDCIKKVKIDFSYEIGNELLPYYPDLAVKIFANIGYYVTALEYFLYIDDEDGVRGFMSTYNLTPNFINIFGSLLHSNPDTALKFAFVMIDQYPESYKLQLLDTLTDNFLRCNAYDQAIQCLLGSLKNDSEKEYDLQNKLIILCLKYHHIIAENIFKSRKYTFYDKQKIVQICEKMGLFHLALWNVETTYEICRFLKLIETNDDELFQYLSYIPSDSLISCIKELGSDRDCYLLANKIVNYYYELSGDERFLKLINGSREIETTCTSEMNLMDSNMRYEEIYSYNNNNNYNEKNFISRNDTNKQTNEESNLLQSVINNENVFSNDKLKIKEPSSTDIQNNIKQQKENILYDKSIIDDKKILLYEELNIDKPSFEESKEVSNLLQKTSENITNNTMSYDELKTEKLSNIEINNDTSEVQVNVMNNDNLKNKSLSPVVDKPRIDDLLSEIQKGVKLKKVSEEEINSKKVDDKSVLSVLKTNLEKRRRRLSTGGSSTEDEEW